MSAIIRRTLFLPLFLLLCVADGFASDGHAAPVDPIMVIPFFLLLLAIAVAPFINKHWWEKNYPIVSVLLGLITVSYYLFFLQRADRVLTVGYEYVSFIALVGSLFVVAGGIHIRIRGRSTPMANLFLLLIGAVISNVIGTTGASMILIRPYLRVNRYRIRPFHVVFFIFIVSNMGGALTPIGDPPLFLGYLEGIPFFWVVETVWLKWLVAMAIILAIFFVMDSISFGKLTARIRHEAEEKGEEGEVSGLQNVFFLSVILIAVFITRPIFVREILMAGAAAGSYFTTKKTIHEKNEFNFLPIKEVALLFLGLFATMIPALDWLELNAEQLSIRSPGVFFWATGLLSSVLDNAPTYLNFLSAQLGLFTSPDVIQQVQHFVQTHGGDLSQAAGPVSPEARQAFVSLVQYHYPAILGGHVTDKLIAVSSLIASHSLHVQAVSLGAVFFGACTYIGNGPNFMVKSIADQAGVHPPSFFGYIFRYSLPILIPTFLLVWILFFRG